MFGCPAFDVVFPRVRVARTERSWAVGESLSFRVGYRPARSYREMRLGSQMTWFERLTGCTEDSADQVRESLLIDGNRLCSKRNGKSWLCGELKIPSLGELRENARKLRCAESNSVREVVANVKDLHRDPMNRDCLFQVASQFNLLEMMHPDVTPERGVGIYERDVTQGPACAIAAGAGTIYRNYFAEVNGRVGQSEDNQIDCLAGVGTLLENDKHNHWQMVNGYALPTSEGLRRISRRLLDGDESSRDEIREALRIGIQWDTQVTLGDASHTVSQAYCSAMPVSYTEHASELWEPFARLILESAYEATLCAAITNRHNTGQPKVYLTLLGGRAFGNEPNWILDAVRRALRQYSDCGLEIAIVSFSRSRDGVRNLVQEFD